MRLNAAGFSKLSMYALVFQTKPFILPIFYALSNAAVYPSVKIKPVDPPLFVVYTFVADITIRNTKQ